jgi:hypothetical protein
VTAVVLRPRNAICWVSQVDLTDRLRSAEASQMEMTMKKFLAAFLMLGLMVSAGASMASAAQLPQYQANTYVGGNG